MENVSNNIKKEGTVVLTRVILFLVYYVTLIVIGFLLLVGATWVTFSIPDFLSGLEYVNVKLLIAGVIVLLAMWWFCIQIGFYLIKPLFIYPRSSSDNRLEINERDCPGLFSMIRDVAHATGNKMPKHVYLSPEVNACVFYDRNSIWSVFLPTRKNLMVGVGLLHGMSTSEVKAILSHEFGHFSQQSMRIGTMTFRLMLIIRTMIDYAQKQQQEDAIARSMDDYEYRWYWYLSVYPISFITKKTISFYNWIEKKNRSLSRYMEFEADIVACKIVGARSFISSLCKLEILSDRYSTYEKLLADTLAQGHYVPEYWQGYVFIYEQLSRGDKLTVEKNILLDTPIGDNAKFPSKISIVDGWNTHPTLSERINNARQYANANKTTCTDAPADLVGTKTLNAIGEIRQRFIAANLQEPVDWQKLSAMSLNEFEESFSRDYEEHYFLSEFLNKRIHSFELLTDEDFTKTEKVENPFTEVNRNLILQYNQGVEDWQILDKIKSGDMDVIHFLYDGKLYSDAKEPIALQDEYLKPIFQRWLDLDVNIYKFLWQNLDEKEKNNLNTVYWTIMYANDASYEFAPIKSNADEINNGLAFYQSHGSDVTLTEETKITLATNLHKFLQNFDFDNTLSLFGDIKNNEGESLSKIMTGWKQISLLEHYPLMSDTDLLNTIGEIASLLDFMLDAGTNQWRKYIIQTYDNSVIEQQTRQTT